MKRDIAFSYLVLAALIGASQTHAQQRVSTNSLTIEKVSLCVLTKDWKKYDHATVRIEAVYRAGFEVNEVYDPSCPTSEHTAWVALVPYGSPSPIPPELKERLNELLKQNGRARITVVGEFDGPKRVDIPAGLSPEAAAVLRAGGSRYGHQNHWEFQFTFSKVEKVEAVPASDPWPRWTSEKEK